MPTRRFRSSARLAGLFDAAPSPYGQLFALVSLALALASCANVLGIKDFVSETVDGSQEPSLPTEDASLGADAADAHSQPDVGHPPDVTQGDGPLQSDGAPKSDGPPQGDGPSDSQGNGPEGGPPDSAAACVAGGACTPAGDCHNGTFVCGDAGAVCAATTAVTDGTPCGATAGFVCSGGTCIACNAGGDCSDAGTPCVRSTYDCHTGVAVCTAAGNVADGTPCNGTMFCYSGTCSACTTGASCSPSSKPCDQGKVTSCAGGTMVCTDQGTAAAAGTACQSASITSGVCDGQGNCVDCTPNATCSPATPCKSGTMSCSSGPACNPGSNINEGMSCGSGSICVSGSCVSCAGNCPNGCCNASGCVPAGAQTTSNCGTGVSGGTCQACPAPSGSGSASCSGNACGYSCATGFHPCPPNACADNTSPSTCGTSCNACQVANGTAGCDGTNCTVQSCNTNYANCSGTCLNVSGTDGNNCGACGHMCMSGICMAGKCQPWVVAQPSACPVDAATDGTNVVWLDSSAGVRQASAAGGGTPTTPATPITLAPVSSGYGLRKVAMANGVVAWLTGDPGGGQIDVWTATEGTANSGANITSMGSSSGLYGTLGFAINPSGGTAYAQLEDLAGGGLSGIEACGLGLGNSCNSLIAYSTSDLGEDVAVNGSYLFYTTHGSGTVTRYAFSGGSTTIASGQGAPFLLTLDSSYVYWANFGTNAFSVNRTLQSTAGSTPVLSNTSGTLNRIATDGTYLYFGGIAGTTKVGYVPVGSGGTASVTPLVLGSSGQATWVAASGGAVYWCDSADNTIRGVRAPP